jgi:thymidylate synthase
MGANIPVLMVSGPALALAWELSLLELWQKGCEIRTEYDRRDSSGAYLDPPSKDCSMCVVVEDPLGEPMIHRCFPGGLEDLEEYRQEVVEGIKDHWVRDPSDPTDTRWEYTYHGRLFSYEVPGLDKPIDQMERSILATLTRTPHSRRAQAITWQPWIDTEFQHPPCMQSIWCRLHMDESGQPWLNMNVRFRSRDAYDAAFMNMFALIHLQERLAEILTQRLGQTVGAGRYVDWSDSYHIYGRRMEEFRQVFLRQVEKRTLAQRTWTRREAQPDFERAREEISRKIRQQDENRRRR